MPMFDRSYIKDLPNFNASHSQLHFRAVSTQTIGRGYETSYCRLLCNACILILPWDRFAVLKTFCLSVRIQMKNIDPPEGCSKDGLLKIETPDDKLTLCSVNPDEMRW